MSAGSQNASHQRVLHSTCLLHKLLVVLLIATANVHQFAGALSNGSSGSAITPIERAAVLGADNRAVHTAGLMHGSQLNVLQLILRWMPISNSLLPHRCSLITLSHTAIPLRQRFIMRLEFACTFGR